MKENIKDLNYIIEEIYEASKTTTLYKDMTKRKGKPAIFKGNRNPNILFIGEAGGINEDKTGLPFCGKAGQILDNWIKENLKETYAVINCVPIMPQKEGLTNKRIQIRTPNKGEIDYFRPYINKLITCLNPKHIIILGRSANYFIRKDKLINTKWKNNIGFIYHPAYYIRNGKDGMDDFCKLYKSKPKHLNT